MPHHSQVPGIVYGYATDYADEAQYYPICYGSNSTFQQGAGIWMMSAGTLVEVLSRMDPSSNLPQLLTIGQVTLLRTGLVDTTSNFTSLFGLSGVANNVATKVLWNGVAPGSGCACELSFEPDAQMPGPGGSTAIALLYDTDYPGGVGSGEMNAIKSLVAALENQSPWGPDLFPLLD